MTKQEILDEICRTAKANGGTPLGRLKFYTETGIKEPDWGKYWVRWSEAVQEAGLSPNEKQVAYTDEFLLDKLVSLTREIGRFPIGREIRMRARKGDGFPSDNTFQRLGSRRVIATKVLTFLKGREGFDDVRQICEKLSETTNSPIKGIENPATITWGYVYLMKSGKNYKIGATNDIGRRGREIALELPDPANTIHVIKTDDPFGIEAYWHRRFSVKRKNSEWFELDRIDVAAFKRRKTM